MTTKRLLLIITTGLALIFVGQFISKNNLAEAACYNCYTAVYDAFCWSGGYDKAGQCPRSERWDYKTGANSNAACGGTESGSTDYVVKSGESVNDSFCPAATPPPPPATPPTATITGDPAGVVDQTLNYNADVKPGSNTLTKVEILVTKKKAATETELPSTNCTGAGTRAGTSNWCQIKLAASGYNPSSWTPKAIGTYIVTLNVVTGSSPNTLQCTGYHPNAAGIWTRCDPLSTGDSVIVTVSQAPVGSVSAVVSSDQKAITGGYLAQVNRTHSYTASVSDNDGNVVQGEVWVEKVDGSPWSGNCPTLSIFNVVTKANVNQVTTRGPWCLIGYYRPSSAVPNFTIDTASWTPSIAGDYYVVVNAYDNTENKCSGNPTVPPVPAGWQDCGRVTTEGTEGLVDLIQVKVASPPSITSLSVGNQTEGQTGGFTGTDRVSGLQASEGGSNWHNPAKITLTATKGTGDVKFYATAFYDKKQGQTTVQPALTSLTAIKDQIATDQSRGFILGYAAQGCANTTNDCYVDNTGSPFSAGKHYVYTKAFGWKDISSYGGTGLDIKDNLNTTRILTISPGTSGTDNAQWQVWYFAAFGAKNMYTPGFVVDSNNLTKFEVDL